MLILDIECEHPAVWLRAEAVEEHRRSPPMPCTVVGVYFFEAPVEKAAMADLVRDVFLAFARVHILHHAAEEKVFGVGLMKELARHGYKLGPGTLYPLLHRLESDGLLVAEPVVLNGKSRKYYVITRKGKQAMTRIRPKLNELVLEVKAQLLLTESRPTDCLPAPPPRLAELVSQAAVNRSATAAFSQVTHEPAPAASGRTPTFR
jgi:DNA-binding PadR family transcriptional regulator